MSEMVYRQLCEHGRVHGHWWHPAQRIALSGPPNIWCPGGSEVRLDHERVLRRYVTACETVCVTVQDIIDALGEGTQ